MKVFIITLLEGNILADKVTHYYPNAMLLFVSSYQKQPGENLDFITASNIGDVKEITSLKTLLTVKGSPGTLSATIINTGGKFHRKDSPETEIPILYKYSQGKKRLSISAEASTSNSTSLDKNSSQTAKEYRLQSINPGTTKTVVEDDPGNFYEFKDYATWRDFEHLVLEDKVTGQRYPLYYDRNNAGEISDYWTFDSQGKIISIDKPSTLTGVLDGSTITAGSENKSFILHRITNKFFTETYKDKNIQGTSTEYKKGRCRIEAMDKVICFMSKRFNDIPGKIADMERVFTGVITSVQDGYQGNEETITIQAEDVTKYMRLSYINVNPALLLDRATDINQTPDQKITVWTSILKGLSAPDIIRLLTLGHNYLSKKSSQTQSIDGIGYYDIGETAKIGTRVKFNPEDNSFVEVEGNKNRRKINFKQALGALFTTNTVHVVDPYRNNKTNLKGFRNYEVSLSASWSYYQGEWKTRRELADRVAEDTHFVFYADKNGEIWFHPPRFSNAWIVGAEDPRVYVIDTDSLVSYGFVETDQNIYSSVYVTTEPDFAHESLANLGWYTTSVRDDGVLMKYGQRFFTASNPIINTKDNREKSLIAYGKSLLQRLLAGKYQGQVTLTGRPEIEQGRPVLIPILNRIYYVETVEHELTFGSQYTTTLSLSYGRKPWEYIPELMSFSAEDEVYMTDAALYQYLETVSSTQKQNVKDPTSSSKVEGSPSTNNSNSAVNQNYKSLLSSVIYPLQTLLQKKVSVTSGISSRDTNPDSQHPKGQAADIGVTNMDMRALYENIKLYVKTKQLVIDQCIYETDHVHISYKKDGSNRKEFLIKIGENEFKNDLA